jgi:hypothetical protein
MNNAHMAFRGVLEQLVHALPMKELGITEVRLRKGIDEIHAHLLRIGLDAFHARQSGVPFHAAAEDGENYPHLRRFHLSATDFLQLSLPRELIPWFERLIRGPVPPITEELQRLLARLAIDSATPAAERACIEFLLFQGIRLNLVITAWREQLTFASAGVCMDHVDRTADEELAWLLKHTDQLGPDDSALRVAVAQGMVSLTLHVQAVLDELRRVTEDVAKELRLRAVFESYLKNLDLTDAVLIRNRFAPQIDEQRLPLEILRAERPLALAGISRAAMDQRVKRLTDSLRAGRNIPERKAPAFIDIIEQRFLEADTTQ